MSAPWLSVVVPVLNEVARVDGLLADLLSRPGVDEVVVVDGGSDDGTWQHLQRQRQVISLQAPRGRGQQLHAGACRASGQVLWFVHADARLPPNGVALVRQTLLQPGVVAGAFRTRTTPREPHWIERVLPLADARSRYTRLPYGDQALFCRADAYHRIGGYPAQPLLEDVELARRLRNVGGLVVRPEHVEVCARRWMAHPVRTTLVMNTFPMLYRLGVSPERLARWYGTPR